MIHSFTLNYFISVVPKFLGYCPLSLDLPITDFGNHWLNCSERTMWYYTFFFNCAWQCLKVEIVWVLVTTLTEAGLMCCLIKMLQCAIFFWFTLFFSSCIFLLWYGLLLNIKFKIDTIQPKHSAAVCSFMWAFHTQIFTNKKGFFFLVSARWLLMRCFLVARWLSQVPVSKKCSEFFFFCVWLYSTVLC